MRSIEGRPRLLDVCCGAGGAAKGYHDAGFDVVGVDIEPQPRYPFEFIQGDVLDVLTKMIAGDALQGWLLSDFTGVHASPPCQAYSDLQHLTGREYPRLIEPVRELLKAAGLPYVIENVESAPLIDPVVLCGTAFPGLRVLRHRQFETSFPVTQPAHVGKHPLVFTHDKRKRHYGQLDQDESYVQVTGGGNSTVANARSAMGIDWMSKLEVNEAIPPVYAEYVGHHLMGSIRAAALVTA